MHGSIWHDIGDTLRSIASKNYKKHRAINYDQLEIYMTGYFDAARPGIRLEAFTQHSLQAAASISTELAIRYLNDIVSEDYFSWDETTYVSRHDHHMEKVKLYKTIAKSLMKRGE
jgi:hypothetical protein